MKLVKRLVASDFVRGMVIGSLSFGPVAGLSSALGDSAGVGAPSALGSESGDAAWSELDGLSAMGRGLEAIPTSGGGWRDHVDDEVATGFDEWIDINRSLSREAFGTEVDYGSIYTLEESPLSPGLVGGSGPGDMAFVLDVRLVVETGSGDLAIDDAEVLAHEPRVWEVWGVFEGPTGWEWVQGTAFSLSLLDASAAPTGERVTYFMVWEELEADIVDYLQLLPIGWDVDDFVPAGGPAPISSGFDCAAELAEDVAICAAAYAVCQAWVKRGALGMLVKCVPVFGGGPLGIATGSLCVGLAIGLAMVSRGACRKAFVACLLTLGLPEDLIDALLGCGIILYKYVVDEDAAGGAAPSRGPGPQAPNVVPPGGMLPQGW